MNLAVAAHQGMRHDWAIAAATSDYQATVLARHTTEQALLKLKDLLYADQMAGLVTLGQPTTDPHVVDIRIPEVPLEIVLADCHDSNQWRKYKATGGFAPSQAIGRSRIETTIRNINNSGTWKVADLKIDKIGTC